MFIKTEAKKLLERHRKGELCTSQFLHRLNHLVSGRNVEPDLLTEVNGQWLVQSTNANVIAAVLDSDAEIVARKRDRNKFTCKIRAVATREQLVEILDKSGVNRK